MCGRFVGFRSLEQLKTHFPIDKAACEVTENYNVAPSQEVLAIVTRDGENWLDRFHWGLVPFWAKDVSMGARMINARAETVASKPSFRTAFKKRRCLIPADGFFEWQQKKGEKQPIFIRLPGDTPFAFAGLWESWGPEDDTASVYLSCTIITTEASDSMRRIHHRMPVVLRSEAYAPWLDPENDDLSVLEGIITTGFHTEFVSHPVSRQVNSARNNDATNIKPTQMELEF